VTEPHLWWRDDCTCGCRPRDLFADILGSPNLLILAGPKATVAERSWADGWYKPGPGWDAVMAQLKTQGGSGTLEIHLGDGV
jgi:hypothetical protein